VTPKAPSSPQLDLLFDANARTQKPAQEPVREPVQEPQPSSTTRRSLGHGRRTWLVHQLVSEARELVEEEFSDVWVEGEISNFRPASSGHIYFTLKDAEAQLPVVLFRRQAMLLRFRPEDGLHVRVRGKVSVYEQRGQLQLVAETMEPVGAGSLQLAFEQLRNRLKAEGLFDQERKRPLPAFPRTVAVLTSPTGAVIRDILNIVNRRHSGLSVLVVPVAVQGENAPAEIEAALALTNELQLADLIVLARGGGSLEDLAAFNSERVARAIAGSRLPVVSAIGHETDFTIADFVADLRAPTPSAAAELITEAQHKVEEQLAVLSNRLVRAARFQLMQARQHLAQTSIAYAQQRLTASLHRLEQRLDDLGFRMESAMNETLRRHQRAVAGLEAAVLRHDPRQQLSSTREILTACQSRLDHALDRALAAVRYRIASADVRLYRAAQVSIASRRSAYGNLRSQLHSLSPLAVLQRGYALVQDESGAVVRSVRQLTSGETVQTRLSDGSFSSKITATTPHKKNKNRTDKDKSTSQ
jgi:exodeoxyribonuclease VII large subunit